MRSWRSLSDSRGLRDRGFDVRVVSKGDAAFLADRPVPAIVPRAAVRGTLQGVGAHRRSDAAFVSVQAEFDRLPFPSGLVDLVVFNASLHYSADYLATLREALRVLRPGGTVTIVDSPVRRDARSGQQMVTEREASFPLCFGFPPNGSIRPPPVEGHATGPPRAAPLPPDRCGPNDALTLLVRSPMMG